jgi:nucleoside 2-deoxyribosyltransferase
MKQDREKVYIAGPMSGFPLLNFPSFDKAAKKWRKAGYAVVSPADLDRVNGTNEYTPMEERCSYRDAMKRDLAAICECDAIALLPDWHKSPGTKVELALGRLLNLAIYDAKTMKKMKFE